MTLVYDRTALSMSTPRSSPGIKVPRLAEAVVARVGPDGSHLRRRGLSHHDPFECCFVRGELATRLGWLKRETPRCDPRITTAEPPCSMGQGGSGLLGRTGCHPLGPDGRPVNELEQRCVDLLRVRPGDPVGTSLDLNKLSVLQKRRY